MYAEIIVDQPSRAVDRVFDYMIPESLDGIVTVGSRVIVPFSGGNVEKEGFVMRVKSETQAKRGIKSIIKLSSEDTAFKPDMVELIEYMHSRYLCTYLELIHMIIPSGTSVKTIPWITLKNKGNIKRHSDTTDRIIELLEENGGGMELISLQSYFEKDISSVIKTLEKNGVTEREFNYKNNVKAKTIRCIRLCVNDDKAEQFISETRSKIQSRMTRILMQNEFVAVSDLVRFSIGNYGAVSQLVRYGIAQCFDLRLERNVFSRGEQKRTAFFRPTPEQENAINILNSSIEKNESRCFLLHGVTGSGKTEVFLNAIRSVLEEGKTALMLVPEISLTPQMVERFAQRFGNRIAILHSGLSLGERYDEWTRIKNGDADIVIGARSALFAPLDNIGVIIIDEEHSDTYKSEMNPKYHARETALYRAKLHNAITILASATPSIESYTKALCGEYTLIEMTRRYNKNKMPDIEIVDMREELTNGNTSVFSKAMYEAVYDNLQKGNQTILFMNRRGYSTFVSCRKCGFVPMCPNCNISLTYHRYDNSLKCHYCGHKQPNYTVCPACQSKYIRYFGGGTQKIEEEVKRLFPLASTIRLDADVTGRKNAHKKILDKFEKEHIDILIGTQMVAKGLDFPEVTLVGVMTADTMLHNNDFRSAERTFDTLEQVVGRAGRGETAGRAVIQTYDPDNFAISLVKTHNYRDFYRKTLRERKVMWYPPFCEMVCIMISDTNENKTKKAAMEFKMAFGDINKIAQKIAILGPIPSGISRIKNKYRWQILIKCDNADLLNERLISAEKHIRSNKEFESVVISLDKNPSVIY